MTMHGVLKVAATAAIALVLAAPALAADDEARARELLNALGCKGCHKINGSGGSLGPALDAVGKRLNGEQIRRQLLDPKAGNPASMMPSYAHLPEQDLNTLADYLEGLK